MVEHVYSSLDSAVQSCSLPPKITLLGDINPALDYLSKIVNQTWSPRDLPAELATYFLFAGVAGAEQRKLMSFDKKRLLT